MIKKIVLISLISLIVGCTSVKNHTDRSLRLKEHLLKWETFQFDGIIEINHKSLSLHKYFTLRKENNIARLDIYDKGLLGMRPDPFISIYFDELIQARIPDIPEIKVLRPEEYPDYFGYFLLFDSLSQLMEHSNEILESNSYKNDQQEFFFDNQQRLNSIVIPDEGILINLLYKTELQEIIIKKEEKKIVTMTIDEIRYKFNKISPLIK